MMPDWIQRTAFIAFYTDEGVISYDLDDPREPLPRFRSLVRREPMIEFSYRELADEADREVKYRRWVYSAQIAKGKLTQELAEKRIAMMEEIAAIFREKAAEEELPF